MILSTERVCRAAVDIAFVVDSSGSISRGNWRRMKAFLKTIVNQFDIGPATGHVAIVSYSAVPRLELRFDTLRGAELTKENVNGYIDKMFHQRRLTYIDRALLFTENNIFTTRNGMRTDVAKVTYKIKSSYFYFHWSFCRLPKHLEIMEL